MFFLPLKIEIGFFKQLLALRVDEQLRGGTGAAQHSVPLSVDFVFIVQACTWLVNVGGVYDGNVVHAKRREASYLYIIYRRGDARPHHDVVVAAREFLSESLAAVFKVLDIIPVPDPEHWVKLGKFYRYAGDVFHLKTLSSIV